MSATWDGARLAAAVAVLKDAGMTESRIARLAGTGRSTVNRWARGTNRPDHDAIQRLAARVHARYPDAARELVEASGYAWAEPDAAPEPEPIPDDVLRVIRRHYPEWKQRQLIEMLETPDPEQELPAGEPSEHGDDGASRAG